MDPTMNDVIDGTVRVMGKVPRVLIDSSDESISLLRKSAIGRFPGLVEQFGTAMPNIDGLGSGGEVETEIAGPAMQVNPIAIFS